MKNIILILLDAQPQTKDLANDLVFIQISYFLIIIIDLCFLALLYYSYSHNLLKIKSATIFGTLYLVSILVAQVYPLDLLHNVFLLNFLMLMNLDVVICIFLIMFYRTVIEASEISQQRKHKKTLN